MHCVKKHQHCMLSSSMNAVYMECYDPHLSSVLLLCLCVSHYKCNLFLREDLIAYSLLSVVGADYCWRTLRGGHEGKHFSY